MAKLPLSYSLLVGAALSTIPINLVSASANERNVEAVQMLREEIALNWNAKSTNARPTGGTGPIGMNYGSLEAEFFDAGEEIRIWFVRDGEHAVLATDIDSSGVPDFVEELSLISEEVAARFKDAGWALPLVDSGRGLPDNGGDARFDIYLLNFGSGSDGVFVKEFCDSTESFRCGGYMAMENDFVGFNFASTSDALRTLFSHEYAHAITAGYFDDLPPWFSEGLATWAENEFADIEADVVRLVSRWYRSPETSLDDSTNPGSGWPYAASAFMVDLSRRFGDTFLRRVLERLATGNARSAAGALDGELAVVGSSLREAWISFTARSWFTGRRARFPADVWLAERMPEITSLNFKFEGAPFVFELGTWSMQAWTSELEADGVIWSACKGREAADLVLLGADGRIVSVAEGDSFALRDDDVLIVSGRPRMSQGVCSELRAAPNTPCDQEDRCQPNCIAANADCDSGCDQLQESCPPTLPSPMPASSTCATSNGGLGFRGFLWAAFSFVWVARTMGAARRKSPSFLFTHEE